MVKRGFERGLGGFLCCFVSFCFYDSANLF